MKRLWHFICYFFHAKKCWSRPKPSSVLIFDACNQDLIMEYLHPYKPVVLHVRGEQINMHAFFASLFRSGNKFNSYVDCFIEKVKPSLIVTFIDNAPNFLTISKRHQKIKTLFIQNGWRSYFADIFETLDRMDRDKNSTLKVDYMMVFGPTIGLQYSRYISGTVVPMGSLKNNLVSRSQQHQQGLIAFVSQWHSNGVYLGDIFFNQEEFYQQVDRPIIQCLANYAREKNKRLAIIRRSSMHSALRMKEEAYFSDLLGEKCVFLEPNGSYPSYQAIDAAEVVVGVDTTLGYEAIARGKKTAIFSIRGNLLGICGLSYGWPGNFPSEGPFWTNRSDSSTFIRILNYLFEVDDVQWRKDVSATNFSSLMIYDPGNSILKSILKKELGSSPVFQC